MLERESCPRAPGAVKRNGGAAAGDLAVIMMYVETCEMCTILATSMRAT